MRLLMMDFDTRLIAAVTRTLRQQGVDVVGTHCVETARGLIQAQHFDITLLDCDSLDPADLTPFSKRPLILTTTFFEHEGKHRLFGHGHLLRKPFTSAQLLSTLRDTVGGLLGSEPDHLIDILRRAHTDAQSVGFSVGEAELFLEHGELVHAQLGEIQGEGALAEVLAASSSSLSRIPVRDVPRTIHRPFQTLMLDLLHRIEVREQGDWEMLDTEPSSPTPTERPRSSRPPRGGPRS